MKRSVMRILKDAWDVFYGDMKNNGIAVFIIVVLFGILTGRIYSTCPFLMITGIPCPGCGLTRAGIALLHGSFARAFEIHPMIYPIVILSAAFVIERYLLRRDTKPLLKYVFVLLGMMFLLYVYRMGKYFPNKEPMTYYRGAFFRFFK